MKNTKIFLIIGIISILLLSGVGLQTGALRLSRGGLQTGVDDSKVSVDSDDHPCCLIRLPPDPVIMSLYYSFDDSQFKTTLKDVPPGYDVTNGVYNGWCVDLGTYIPVDTDMSVMLYPGYCIPSCYSSCISCPPQHLLHKNWNYVNYILNNKIEGFGWDDVRTAMLFFVNFGQETIDPTPLGQAMVDDALANGEGFIPGPSELAAVICDLDVNGQHYQYTIIEVCVPE